MDPTTLDPSTPYGKVALGLLAAQLLARAISGVLSTLGTIRNKGPALPTLKKGLDRFAQFPGPKV